MGFYGNITNTSNTTFSFDRIYPNRLAMDANANNDGIFIGRYVLVEYEQSAAYPNIYINNGKYYSSPNFEEATRIKYKSGGRPASDTSNDVFYLGEFGQKQESEKIYFYMCDGYEAVEENLYATFKQVTAVNKDDATPYLINHNIDYEEYKNAKGYDSSVWTKVNEEKDGKLVTRYRNIADLNSVVPTFDLETDAPTMTPITPHFDADSTNVYYNLHTQPQWGLRVAAQEDENSDSTTTWQFTTYNPATDETITHEEKNKAAAINFNGPAFDAQVGKANILKHDSGENYITILPTGESGKKYYTHTNKNGEKVYEKAPDIQEMRVNLPAIGNMMSDAWDIIHGKQRNDYRGDGENASLQGRLDSFEGIKENQIPVKRNDGTLIGSKINNGKDYEHIGEILKKPVLDTDILENDDPWIRININTDGLVGGTQIGENPDQSNNNGILIQHTFHPTENSQTSIDKNTGSITQNENYKEDFTKVKNTDTGTNDKLKLYTPYVDQAGHVVGYNEETVILPYGYKHFTTNGLVDEIQLDLDNSTGRKTTANNTQDSLAINTKNKWLQIEVTNDKIELAHEIHDTTNSTNTTDWTQTEANTTIPTTTYEFDNAGHYVSHHTENYKLPFGYGKIVGDAGNSAATATYDQIKFTSDEWLTATITEEGEDNTTIVTYSHDYPNVQEDTSTDFDMNTATIQDNKDKIVLETLRHDNTGHIINVNQHTVTLPYGYKTIKIANSSSEATAPAMVVEAGQSAGQTQDTLNLNASNKWIVLDNAEGNTIKFGHKISPLNKKILNPKDTTVTHFGDSFNLLNFAVDEAGHITGCNENEITITIPQGDLTDAVSNGADVITQLTFDKPTGHLISTRTNVGTLKLTGYELPTYITGEGELSANATINDNFGRLEFRLNKEVSDRENAIEKEVSDRNTAITNAIAGIFNKNDDNEINRLAEIIEWINNNPSTATEMQTAIQNNTNAISNEVDLAREKEAEIADALTTETGRATAAEQANATAIENEKIRAENIEQGLQGQIEVLQTTIENLQKQINELKNPPQQPDNGGDEV